MMRVLYFFTVILLSSPAFSQWYIQTTFTPAQSLQTIKFYGTNTGYTTAPLYNSSTYNIHKTTNAAQSWFDQSSGYTAWRFMAIWIIHPDTVYMSGNWRKIIKTVDGGQNWVTLNTNIFPDTNTQFWGLQFVNSFTGYAAGSSGRIIKTTDAGATWFVQPSGVMNAFSSIHFRNESTGYVSGSAIVVKTTNAGATWVNLNAPYINPFENFREIYFTDDNTGYYVSDLGRILKTTNAGTNWTLLTTGVNKSLFGIHFTDPNTAYACGDSGTIIRTTSAGTSWSVQPAPLYEIFTDVGFTSALTGYITTWSGKVLKTTNGGITFIVPISHEVPDEFRLFQNYPNPFNSKSNIKYQISKSLFVRLQIFDALGREIAALVNEEQNPGIYLVSWDAVDFPSGIYYYRMTAGTFTDVKKLVLVK